MTVRGDVVIVRFPYQDGTRGKDRPALVVQCDQNNRRLQNVVVAMITGNIRLAQTEPTQLLVDPSTPEGQSSGLHGRSAVKCENLFTIQQAAHPLHDRPAVPGVDGQGGRMLKGVARPGVIRPARSTARQAWESAEKAGRQGSPRPPAASGGNGATPSPAKPGLRPRPVLDRVHSGFERH